MDRSRTIAHVKARLGVLIPRGLGILAAALLLANPTARAATADAGRNGAGANAAGTDAADATAGSGFAISVPSPTACLGSVSVAGFQMTVAPAGNSGAGNGAALPVREALPIRDVLEILPGDKIRYEPSSLPAKDRNKARISLLLAHAGPGGKPEIKVLPALPADKPEEWNVPIRASVVGLVYGPRGLDVKNVNELVDKNPDLLPELAAYAEHTTQLEALLQTLTTYEQSPSGTEDVNGALQAFSARYNVGVPKLDTTAPTNQQAATLMTALLPSLSSIDPLAPTRTAMVQQSVGLATAVAALFLGTPVVVAAGGAMLFENMRTLAFPGTDFRSTFAQSSTGSTVDLCAKAQAEKSRTRPAYLWVLSVADADPPKLTIPGSIRLGLGAKADVTVASAPVADLRLVSRARNWRLVPESGATSSRPALAVNEGNGTNTSAAVAVAEAANASVPVPVTVNLESSDAQLDLDLSKPKLGPGRYRLMADWDWTPIEIGGALDLRPFADFSPVTLASESADQLISGRGKVNARFSGADFEFVTRVALAAPDGTSQDLKFDVPPAHNEDAHDKLEAAVDTAGLAPGKYRVEFTQSDGKTQSVPVTIHSPNPEIANLPLRANVGESGQTLELQGTGLDRIRNIVSPGVTWELAAIPAGASNMTARAAVVKLTADAHPGERLDAEMSVAGLAQPIPLHDVIEIAGPRPKIASVQPFFPAGADVALRPGELPASVAVSFSVRTANAGSQPALQLACADSSDTQTPLNLHPGADDPRVRLDATGDNTLFLSIDPATVGHSGCELEATLSAPDTGSSDPYKLGRIVRLPRIEEFRLTDQKLDRRLYSGTLTGEDLQLIEKTGWNPKMGFPVVGIPTPVSTDPAKQTLGIALPWPPPSPQAPLYIWLRGETEARQTNARY